VRVTCKVLLFFWLAL